MEETSQEKQTSRKKAGSTPNTRLRRERELRGWSQANVADKLGAQPRLVMRWEMGYASPSPYYRQKLCLLFSKNAEELELIKQDEEDAPAKELPLSNEGDTRDSTLVAESQVSEQDNNTTLEEPEPSEREDEMGLVAEEIAARPLQEEKGYTRVLLQRAQRKPRISRRATIAGLLGGAVLAGASGFWWSKTAAIQPTPALVRPLISTVYIYTPIPAVYVNFVAWSPHGSWIACPLGDKTIRVLEAASGTLNFVYREHTGFVNCVEWAPDEGRIASSSADKTVRIWEPLTGRHLLTYQGHTDAVNCVAWSHDGMRMASCGEDKTVQVWDPFSGKLITTYRRHTKGIWNIKWSMDDQSIATSGLDGGIHVWDPATAKPSNHFIYQGPPGTITEIDWSPDGSQIVSTHVDKTVRIQDALTGYPVLVYTGHSATPDTARWSPDGTLVASGGYDNTIQVWRASSGTLLGTYRKHKDEIIELCWSPDGKHIATASKDDTLHVCNIAL